MAVRDSAEAQPAQGAARSGESHAAFHSVKAK